MKPASLLRRYWLEAVCLIALVLPWLAVFLLGFFWLWQQQAMHWWFVAAALLGSPLLLLRYRKKRVRRDEAEGSLDLDLEASPEWGCKEEDAWKMVQEIASKTVPFSFAEIKPIEDAIQLTFGSIAKYYQPNLSRALWQITLPEALLLIERTLNRLRDVVLRYLPGNQYIMISHGIWLRERYNSHWLVYRPILKGLSQLVRLARIATDPSSALAAEIGFLVKSNLSDGIATTVRRHLTQAIIQEAGRAAIDLYSGRLKLSTRELRERGIADTAEAKADLVGPVRILLSGQVNAGKSSLLNAMAGEVQCATAPIPTTEKAVECRLEVDGKPEVVLVDMPGITYSERSRKALLTEAERSDMILWVASATQPARAPDREALQDLRAYFNSKLERKAPPILGVVTHIDQLSPASEWSPPYDLTRPDRRKTRMIREAVEVIAEALSLDPNAVIPVAVRDVGSKYNVDLLWARIATDLDQARYAKTARLLMASKKVSIFEIWGQAYAAGRWLAGQVWASTFSRGNQMQSRREGNAKI